MLEPMQLTVFCQIAVHFFQVLSPGFDADSVHAVLQCAVQGGAPAAKRIQNRQMFFSELG